MQPNRQITVKLPAVSQKLNFYMEGGEKVKEVLDIHLANRPCDMMFDRHQSV